MTDTSIWQQIEWQYLIGNTPLSITATLCAIAGVICIARQNIWGWPLGVIWAGISAYLAIFSWQLLSDGIMYLSGIPIQIYCWITWYRHGTKHLDNQPFLPTWLPRNKQLFLILAVMISIGIWGICISRLATAVSWIPAPALLWRDSTTTVLNYYAQFLQARKRMENWIGWVIVNILGIHIYWVRGAPVYSIQYAFFLVLGIYGWYQWHKHRNPQTAKDQKT
jgi:nicotinamide mononucleotide transporter